MKIILFFVLFVISFKIFEKEVFRSYLLFLIKIVNNLYLFNL